MNEKQSIAIRWGIVAIALLSILGRILVPVYRDVFHGTFVLAFLVAILTGGTTSPLEPKKISSQKIVDRTKHKPRGMATIESSQKRPRKRRTAGRTRKRKTRKGRR